MTAISARALDDDIQDDGLYQAAGDDIGRIWVHVNPLGIYISSLCFATGAPVMTAQMDLINENGERLSIEPYGCIDTGTANPCATGGYMRYFSAWEIDQVSRTSQNPGEICIQDQNDQYLCVPEWYPVDFPAGFYPVEYVAGCMEIRSFEIPPPGDSGGDSGGDSDSGSGGDSGGGCFIDVAGFQR